MADGEASTSLAPGEPAAVAIHENSDDGAMDDEQEWEYEYSTTETEVCMTNANFTYGHPR